MEKTTDSKPMPAFYSQRGFGDLGDSYAAEWKSILAYCLERTPITEERGPGDAIEDASIIFEATFGKKYNPREDNLAEQTALLRDTAEELCRLQIQAEQSRKYGKALLGLLALTTALCIALSVAML